jgi:hypothetical protein
MGYIRKHCSLSPILLQVLVMLLSGCVIHNPDYPTQWAALDTSDKGNCSALAGVYNERGESAEPGVFYQDRKPVPIIPQLSGILLHYLNKAGPATRVELSSPEPGELEIAAYDSQKLLIKARFSEKEHTCVCNGNSAKVLRFSGSPSSRGAPVVGYEYDAVFLYKAVDGSLVVKTSSYSIGMVFLVILGEGTDHFWYRFMPITAAGQ